MDNPNIDNAESVKNPSPFITFTARTIPATFDTSMSYQEALFALVNYLQTQVTPAINENAEITNEQTKAINELYDFVNHYFDNLDVQEEINNKLDAMVEDGTMAEIINQEIFGELNTRIGAVEDDITNNIKPDIQTNSNNITELQTSTAKNTTDINNLKLKEVRTSQYNRYHLLNLPTLNSFFNNFQIVESNDKRNYGVNYNLSNFKNTGSSTVYVDPSATNDSSTGTQADPDNNLYRAMNHVSSEGTVILKTGIYRRNNFGLINQGASWLKSVNMIAENGVIFTNSDELTWEQNQTYSNIYQATRSAIQNVIDIRGFRTNQYVKLTRVNSLQDCSETKDSYYYNNNIVYVNIGETVTNNKVICNLGTGGTPLNFSSSGVVRKWYIENIICLAGDRHIIGVMSQSGYKGQFTAKDCKFLFANESGENGNGLTLYGVNSLLVNCEASFNNSDGISYKGYSGFTGCGVEINCKGSSNGYNNASTTTSNGSTAHDGCQVIRFKGNYLNNRGANIADVHDNTLSINIECNAFDSIAQTQNSYDADFCAQQSGTTMYLYNCFAKGYSAYNIYSSTGATVNVSNCEYNNTGGSGTINITN